MVYLFVLGVLLIVTISVALSAKTRAYAAIPLGLALLWTAWSAVWVIPQGQTGVTRFLGKVSDVPIPGGQGLVFVNPIADRFTYETRAKLVQMSGKRSLEMTLGRGGVFIMEAGVPYTIAGDYTPQLLAKAAFDPDAAANNAIRAGFRDVAQRYATYEEFSNRRQGLGDYADLPPLEDEVRSLAQGHMNEFFFGSAGFAQVRSLPVIAVGAVQIRKVTPPPTVQAAANEYEAELTALRTAEVQKRRAALEAERVGAIVPALQAIAEIIPPGQTAEGFASAVNAAAQLRLTEAMAKAYAATGEAIADPRRGITPTIIIGGDGAGAPVPTIPLVTPGR